MAIHKFSLKRLIAAGKLRTHFKNVTNDELLDTVEALHDKYFLPKIKVILNENKKLEQKLAASEAKAKKLEEAMKTLLVLTHRSPEWTSIIKRVLAQEGKENV